MENEAKKVIEEIDALSIELRKIQSECSHIPIVKFDNNEKTIIKKCEKC